MECREWLKVGIEEAAAVGFTKCHSHFNLEIAEGDIKALCPESMQKPRPPKYASSSTLFIYLISMLSLNYVPILPLQSFAWNGHLMIMSFPFVLSGLMMLGVSRSAKIIPYSC